MYRTFGCKRSSSSTSFVSFMLATLPVTPIRMFLCCFVEEIPSTAILFVIIIQTAADHAIWILAKQPPFLRVFGDFLKTFLRLHNLLA